MGKRESSIEKKILLGLGGTTLILLIHRVSLGIRELSLASRFGISHEYDLFVLAGLIPTFVIQNMVSVLPQGIIPYLLEVRSQSTHRSQKLLDDLCSLLTLFVTVLVVLMLALGPYCLAQWSNSPTLETTARLHAMIVWYSPTLFLKAWMAVWSLTLQSKRKFAVPSLYSAIPLLSVVAYLLIPSTRVSLLRIIQISTCATFVEFILLMRYSIAQRAFALPRLRIPSKEVIRAVKLYLPVFLGSVFMGLTPVVDRIYASSLLAGDVAALNYSSLLVIFPIVSISTPLALVTLPYFSSLVTESRFDELQRLIRRLGAGIFALGTVLALFLGFSSNWIVKTLYAFQVFSPNDHAQVSELVRTMAPLIPLFLLGTLFVQLLSSLQLQRRIAYGAIGNLAVNIIVGYQLKQRFGITGLAFGSVVVYGVSALYLGITSWRALWIAPFAKPETASPRPISSPALVLDGE